MQSHAEPWACHPSVDLDKPWYAFTAMLDKAAAGSRSWGGRLRHLDCVRQ